MQLLDAGITAQVASKQTRAGHLHRIHRGVYAVGHPGLSKEGRWMAAVLACGPRAVLSHQSAAHLWGLLSMPMNPVHVTVPYPRDRITRRGIRVHRSRTLAAANTTRLNGIPVTTVARTIADLRSCLSQGLVRKVIRQAEFDKRDLGPIQTDRTRSELELEFLRFCRRRRLAEPEVNVRIGAYTIDFVWPSSMLAVETDWFGSHGGEQAFEDDRAQDAYLRSRGYEVMRITGQMLREQPNLVATSIRRCL